MRNKTRFTVALLLLASGCTTPVPEGDLPEKRPLGHSYAVFTAEVDPEAAQWTPAEAHPVDAILTMDQVLTLALRDNPDLKASSWAVRAAQARQWQRGMRPNPNLNIELENVAGSGAFSGTRAAETTIALSQVVETAGRRDKRSQVAALESLLAGWDHEATRLEVMTKTSQAFVEVHAMQERARLAEQQVTLAQQVATTVDRRVDAGKDSPVESAKARLASAQIRIDQQRIARELSSLRQDLAASWGGRAHFLRVEGPWETIAAPPDESTLLPLVEKHPAIARWDAEIKRRQALIQLEQAVSVPSPTVLGAFRRFSDPDESAFVVGLSLPLPSANRNQGAIKAARMALAQAQQQRGAARVKVRTQLARGYASLSSAYTAATEVHRVVLPAAQEAFDSARTGYRGGKFDFLVVLDAQRTLFEVRMQYLDALGAYHVGKAEVEFLIAQALDSLGEDHD